MASKIKERPSFEVIDAIVHKDNVERGAIIPILQEIQDVYGYVPLLAIERIAENTGATSGEIFGIVTFYNMFRLQPLGENLVKVCHGTACHLARVDRISKALSLEVGATEGQTSPDGKFTVERVACLGCCSLAPCVMIDGEVHGELTPEEVRKIVVRIREGARKGTLEV